MFHALLCFIHAHKLVRNNMAGGPGYYTGYTWK